MNGIWVPVRWVWRAALGAAVLASIPGCNKPSTPPAPHAMPVTTIELVPHTVTNYFEAVGQTFGSEDVEIRARVAGFLDRVLFVEGTQVTNGQPLYIIDERPLRASLDQALGSLAQAEANWDKARRDTNRFGPLLAKRAISRQQYDDSLAQESATAAIVQSARAAVTNASLQLAYTRIFSPVDGIIGRNEVSAGNLVGQGIPTLLATVSKVDPIHVRFSVSEREYLRWRRAANPEAAERALFELILADGSLHPAKGTLVFGDREVDPRTGTFLLEVAFPNPRQIIRPGQFARVRFPVGLYKDIVLVPQNAVQELQATFSVFVVTADNKAESRRIELGPRLDTRFVVLKGLAPGEKLVVDGIQRLQNGVPVKASATNLTSAVH